MAYLLDSLKRFGSKDRKKVIKNELLNKENKLFIFIMILSIVVIVIDSMLIIKFLDIVTNI